MYDLSNPWKTAILKHAEQLLGKRYGKFQQIIMRASTSLVTNEDATTFAQMMAELYESGYLKAVEDYRKAVESHGLKVVIRPENKK